MKRSLFAFLISATLLLVGNGAHATPQGWSDYCTTTSTGGYCYGTFYGFVVDQQPGTATYATFTVQPGFSFFGAGYHGKYFSCIAPPSNTGLAQVALAAQGARGYFFVEWDTGGNCTVFNVANNSFDQSY